MSSSRDSRRLCETGSTPPGVPLFSGDEVTTLQGKADVLFTDQGLITLDVGTTVVIEEQQQPEPG
jgi:hypothetical protein